MPHTELYEARAQVMKALAHPTRLLIVEHLAQGPASVGELAKTAGQDISTVSRHLAQLKSVGVVASSRKATQVFYYLATPCVMQFFQCIDQVLASRIQQLEEARRIS